MKNVKNFIKNNIKILIAFVLEFALIGGITTYATIVIQGTKVGSTNSSMSATTVQGAIDEIYKKALKCPDSAFKLGDYFTLVPDVATYTIKKPNTGYSSDQTIQPSELTLWRVIDIHSDGSVDAVSEYVSSTSVRFQGTTGYEKFVGTLQALAAQYAKAGYTINTRMMGYGGQTPTITDTKMFDTTTTPTYTTSTPSPTTGTGQEYTNIAAGDIGDTLYLKDYQLVSNVYKSEPSTYGYTGIKAYSVSTGNRIGYWLASRRYVSGDQFEFSGRYISIIETISDSSFRSYGSGTWYEGMSGDGLRPIITLKSGVTISGGSGTKTSPYTLS